LGETGITRRASAWAKSAPSRAQFVVLDDGLVVDVFGRDIHQREIEGALVGADVFGGDGVDVLLHVAA
jgi:hypothetical protein